VVSQHDRACVERIACLAISSWLAVAMRRFWWLICGCWFLAGCSALPDISHQPRYHNPFPQLSRVAVLPFYNQSAEPTVDQDKIALAYYNELQAIRGFEVVPVGVTKILMAASGIHPQCPEDYQKLAQFLDVDAVIVGSVTDYTPYYPPRLGLSVRWYAANPNFHPIPPGYGLPWGTAEEEFIPNDLVFEAEFALAKQQLKTQTPEFTPQSHLPAPQTETSDEPKGVMPAAAEELSPAQSARAEQSPEEIVVPESSVLLPPDLHAPPQSMALPPDWPDPRGFVPPPPSPKRPLPLPQYEPIMTHTRLYHGHDAEFTERLAKYYYFRDDGRFGDWQGYLQRSDDFIRFCCHLHIAETLTARGGAGESRVVWRWPIRRYER
jgi:hypothetical protein